MSHEPVVRTVVLLHGYEGSGPTHWQTWLSAQLPTRGVTVRYPHLPAPLAPELAAWSRMAEDILDSDDPEGRVVVAHSLGCHLWAHLAARSERRLADRAILVAPPGIAETREQFPGLPPGPMDAATLARAAGRTQLVLGTDDPWRQEPEDFRDVGLLCLDVPGGGHLNVESGYGPWPALLASILDRAEGLGVAG